jgi:hypothetical protein
LNHGDCLVIAFNNDKRLFSGKYGEDIWFKTVRLRSTGKTGNFSELAKTQKFTASDQIDPSSSPRILKQAPSPLAGSSCASAWGRLSCNGYAAERRKSFALAGNDSW